MPRRIAVAQNKARLFLMHERLIYSLAHAISKSHQCDVEELIGAGHLAFMHAAAKMDRRGTRFSTLLYTATRNAMLTEAKRQNRHRCLRLDDVAPEHYPAKPHRTIDPRKHLMERFRAASKEGREVIRILLHVPEELIGCCPGSSPKHIRGTLRRYLRSLGWSHNRIWKTFRELKEAMK